MIEAIIDDLVKILQPVTPFMAHMAIYGNLRLRLMLDDDQVCDYREKCATDIQALQDDGVESILLLIGQHRPDLAKVLDCRKGRAWLKQQMEDILIGDATGV